MTRYEDGYEDAKKEYLLKFRELIHQCEIVETVELPGNTKSKHRLGLIPKDRIIEEIEGLE